MKLWWNEKSGKQYTTASVTVTSPGVDECCTLKTIIVNAFIEPQCASLVFCILGCG